MVEIREYLGSDGRNSFSEWFDRLNAEAARKVTAALYRVVLGNFSNVKGVGGGVFECRIDFGPGYRVYFGKDGEQIVILLCGGTKKRQQNDIELAGKCWQDYKLRKRSEAWR
jgi:putative addiction module killer protein